MARPTGNDPNERPGEFLVPDSAEVRQQISRAAQTLLADVERGSKLFRAELEAKAAQALLQAGAGPQYAGFSAVMVNNAFWRERFQRVDFSRRLLLLPRCIEGINPAFTGSGPSTDPLTSLVARARELGYTIRVADGTPLAVKLLAEEKMDAILGISCLESLEKAFEKVRLLGVPSLAVPLFADGCNATRTDLDLVREFLELTTPSGPTAPGAYQSLFRRVYDLFQPPALGEYLETKARVGPAGLPGAEELTAAWMRQGGKRFRPFITVAVYQALAGGDDLPQAVALAAFAVEVFHKASLVHDDVEDDDPTRYGKPTIHKVHGKEVAINVGDYMLGLGYRLIARTVDYAGAEKTAALLDLLSRTHMDLARGQGLELAWRESGRVVLEVDEVVRIYALKTAPAFTAALGIGLLLAGGEPEQQRQIKQYSRYLGVAFQVLNDLQDWEEDLQAGRPTILPALAALAGGGTDPEVARQEYSKLGVFEQAEEMVTRCRERALVAADQVGSPALAELLRSLLEIVLGER